jgi:hypothetical protein
VRLGPGAWEPRRLVVTWQSRTALTALDKIYTLYKNLER